MMSEQSALVLGLLLELEPCLLTDKEVAASVLGELADVAGAISAVILVENGEDNYQAVLNDMIEQIDHSAREVVKLDALRHTYGSRTIN